MGITAVCLHGQPEVIRLDITMHHAVAMDDAERLWTQLLESLNTSGGSGFITTASCAAGIVSGS